jgi:hypothetical protein
MLTNKVCFLNFFSMLNSFKSKQVMGPWLWGNWLLFFFSGGAQERGPVGQMPHQSMVLKSALLQTTLLKILRLYVGYA